MYIIYNFLGTLGTLVVEMEAKEVQGGCVTTDEKGGTEWNKNGKAWDRGVRIQNSGK